MRTVGFYDGDFSPDIKLENSKIVVLPIPYDGTSTWLKGADKGPEAILKASPNMEYYDIETNSQVVKEGIYTDAPVSEKSSPEALAKASEKKVSEHLEKGKFVVVLGGEHSVSIGPIMAFSKKFSDLTVLQLDAHTDLREEYHGSKFNHACVMARAKEKCNIVQVGIRSMSAAEKKSISPDRVFFAKDIHGNEDWMEKAISKLTKNVYLTIDLDAFDPSIMPFTGTPEPGGMQWYQALKFIRKVAESRNLVGFDVVELCPDERNKAPDFLAAKLIYTILSYKFMKP
ncbi:agmatinase [Candidatus Woesearchaeota archaeon]|nr:agmatinase [Candidatus Woesearchaeota archaeon]